MYDPKFEKEVQQKMEGLEFSPSDAVWTNIEQAVNADNKRRRLPFFWMFFLSGVLLLGAGIVYRTFRPSGTGVKGLPATARSATTGASTPASTLAGIPAATGANHSAATAAATPRATSGTPVFSSTAGTTSVNTVGKSPVMAFRGGRKISTGIGDRYGAVKSATGATTTPGATTTASDATIFATKGLGEERGDEIKTGRHNDHIQGLASFRLPAPKITGARLPVQKSSGLTSLSTPRRPWEAAFTGGIGISSFRQVAVHQPNVSSNVASRIFSYFNAPGLYAYSNPNISKGGPSPVEAGPAFYAGILARKPLSARWAVTIGLDLSYNSSRVHTGPIVNGYAPAALSLINAAATAPIQNYPYYVAGDDQVFTNRYYSLEIPATIQWQLNHSRTLPLFLESGLSFSYLVSSDALYYNSNSGVYFKDRDVVNRAQVNFTSSLMVGLPLGRVNLQAGPQLEYGLTSLLRTSATTGQHLFYGGLRVVIIPKGKK